MILVALALNHNPEIVTLAHSVRLMALNLFLPLWIFYFVIGKSEQIVLSHCSLGERMNLAKY